MNEISKKAIDITNDFELTPEGRINPFNKNNKLLTVNCVENILKKYGIFQNINNLEIYQMAMVHESYTINHIKNVCIKDKVEIVENPDGHVLLQPKSYERLEFLGDTLVDAVIGSYIFKRFPNGDEGFLSLIKKKLISRWVLGDLAKKCSLNEYMIISKTLDDKANARDDIKKCCDLLEAFIGAIYLDFKENFKYVNTFLINLIEHPDSLLDFTSYITEGTDSKTKLRNLSRRNYHCDVKYNIIYDDKTKLYNCKITLKNKIIGESNHNNSKQSEFDAANNALFNLGIN